jgi:hypothetical protein
MVEQFSYFAPERKLKMALIPKEFAAQSVVADTTVAYISDSCSQIFDVTDWHTLELCRARHPFICPPAGKTYSIRVRLKDKALLRALMQDKRISQPM